MLSNSVAHGFGTSGGAFQDADRLFTFRHRYVEAVQGGRHEAVQANQIDQLIGSVLAESVDRQTVKWLGQDAAPDERIGEIEGDALLLASNRSASGRRPGSPAARLIPSRSATAICA